MQVLSRICIIGLISAGRRDIMKSWIYIFLTLFVLLVAVCSYSAQSATINKTMNAIPEDFSIEYQWIAGSMPPPYHYEFMIRVKASGEGEVIYWPNYSGAGTPEWKENFTATQTQIEQLYQIMENNNLFTEKWQAQERHIVGGSHEFMTATANRKKIQIPAFVIPEQTDRVKKIYDALRVLPPKNIWTKLGAQRQEYMDKYERGKGK
jgi:hypothetical protein